MIIKVFLLTLTLPLYAILLCIWCHFEIAVNLMSDVEKVLEEDESFADNVDTLKENVEQHRKKEC